MNLNNVTVNGVSVFNGTPHSITIIGNSVYKPEIRKWVIPNGMEPVILGSIPSSGILSAKIESTEPVPLLIEGSDGVISIPSFGKKVTGVDELPSGYSVYIVSALYASAYSKVHGNMNCLYTVADPVYSEDGRTILGSRGICPAF